MNRSHKCFTFSIEALEFDVELFEHIQISQISCGAPAMFPGASLLLRNSFSMSCKIANLGDRQDSVQNDLCRWVFSWHRLSFQILGLS